MKMSYAFSCITLASITLVVSFSTVSATETSSGTIKIPIGKQGSPDSSISTPARGMNKEAVMQIYGPPIKINDSKGVPPITSWVYANFTVYFESDTVIHSTLKHTPQN